MTLLEKALDLYKDTVLSHPRTHPAVLQLKQYIVFHHGHEGTKGMAEIDHAPAQNTAQADSGTRPMRAFQHPLNKAVPVAADPYTNIPRAESNPIIIEKTGSTIGTKSNVLAQKANTDEQGKQKAPSNLIPSKEVAVSDAPGGEGADIELPVAIAPILPVAVGDAPEIEQGFPDLDPKEFLSIRAKSVGEKYTKENIQYWLTQRGVTFSGKESQTQLGALLLQDIRK